MAAVMGTERNTELKSEGWLEFTRRLEERMGSYGEASGQRGRGGWAPRQKQESVNKTAWACELCPCFCLGPPRKGSPREGAVGSSFSCKDQLHVRSC